MASGGRNKSKSKILQGEVSSIRGFQESQEKLLKSISDSMSSNLQYSQKLEDSLSKISNYIDNMTKSSSESFNFQEEMRRRDRELHEAYSRSKLRSISNEEKAISEALKKIKDLGDDISQEEFEEYRRIIQQNIRAEERKSEVVDKLNSKLMDLANHVAEVSNRYSQLSNELISVSGSSATDVRDTRATIVRDTISQLNKETGMFFNPEKSYEKMISIAKEANIGSLEVIEEISRPMLIASESMDINNGQIAEILGKWYTRYQFSSGSMETMIDEIRGNTAGNNATAEATLKNISKFQNFIGVYADNTQEMQNMVAAISAESSRLESAGINSGYIFDYMYQIGTGDLSNASPILSLLANSGTGIDWNTASTMIRSGNEDDMRAVSEALAEGARRLMDNLKDTSVSAEAVKAFGLDYEELMNILSASGALMTPELFESSVSDTGRAIDSIDGKFNTFSDKLLNLISGMSERTAAFQENIGLGMSDLIQIGLGIAAVSKLGGIGNALGGTTTGGAGALLSKFGGALKGAGSAAVGLVSAHPYVAAGVAALGAVALIANKIHDDNNALSGNAEAVSNEIESLGDKLKKENKTRLEEISTLSYNFDRANDIEDKRRLIEEAGLASEEEANSMEADALQSLLDSYKNAALNMDKVTDELLKTADKYYTKRADEQAEQFAEEMSKISDFSKMENIMKLLSGSVGEKGQEYIDRFLNSDASNLLERTTSYNNLAEYLKKSGLDSASMQMVAGYAGFSGDYGDTSKYADAVTQMYYNIREAYNLGDSTKMAELIAEKNASEYKDDYNNQWGEATKIIAEKLGLNEYARGSNYIGANQLALIHEGEAVVPKKYNPSANTTELEMLRKYYQEESNSEDSEIAISMREMAIILQEIKSFLSYWRDDNLKRENMNRVNPSRVDALDRIARFSLY